MRRVEGLTVIRWGLVALGLPALVACGPGAAPDGGVDEATVSTTTALPPPGVEVGQPVEEGPASGPESPTDDELEALMAELDTIEELLDDTERLLSEPAPEP